MSLIDDNNILRIHTQGHGVNLTLAENSAKSLENYDVIIANPESIIHMFESADSKHLTSARNSIKLGNTSTEINDEAYINSLSRQLGKRIFELIEFLKKGGLLIYYLCPAFTVKCKSLSIDNYAWLNVLAPDASNQDAANTEKNSNLSSMASGSYIEITEDGKQSEFINYLSQPGIQWNTLIRENFLTEGYIPLARSGNMKCVSAKLSAGNNGGTIIFFPAPYSPDYDRVLIDCINQWAYANKKGSLSTAQANSNLQTIESTTVAEPDKTQSDVASANTVKPSIDDSSKNLNETNASQNSDSLANLDSAQKSGLFGNLASRFDKLKSQRLSQSRGRGVKTTTQNIAAVSESILASAEALTSESSGNNDNQSINDSLAEQTPKVAVSQEIDIQPNADSKNEISQDKINISEMNSTISSNSELNLVKDNTSNVLNQDDFDNASVKIPNDDFATKIENFELNNNFKEEKINDLDNIVNSSPITQELSQINIDSANSDPILGSNFDSINDLNIPQEEFLQEQSSQVKVLHDINANEYKSDELVDAAQSVLHSNSQEKNNNSDLSQFNNPAQNTTILQSDDSVSKRILSPLDSELNELKFNELDSKPIEIVHKIDEEISSISSSNGDSNYLDQLPQMKSFNPAEFVSSDSIDFEAFDSEFLFVKDSNNNSIDDSNCEIDQKLEITQDISDVSLNELTKNTNSSLNIDEDAFKLDNFENDIVIPQDLNFEIQHIDTAENLINSFIENSSAEFSASELSENVINKTDNSISQLESDKLDDLLKSVEITQFDIDEIANNNIFEDSTTSKIIEDLSNFSSLENELKNQINEINTDQNSIDELEVLNSDSPSIDLNMIEESFGNSESFDQLQQELNTKTDSNDFQRSSDSVLDDLMQKNQELIAKYKEQQKNKVDSTLKTDPDLSSLVNMDANLISSDNNDTTSSEMTLVENDWQVQSKPTNENVIEKTLDNNNEIAKNNGSSIGAGFNIDFNFDIDLDFDLNFDLEPAESPDLALDSKISLNSDDFAQSKVLLSEDVLDLNATSQLISNDDVITSDLSENQFSTQNNLNTDSVITALSLDSSETVIQADMSLTEAQQNLVEDSNVSSISNIQAHSPTLNTLDTTINELQTGDISMNTNETLNPSATKSNNTFSTSWSKDLNIPEVNALIAEKNKYINQINQIKNHINNLENQIAFYETHKNALLASSGQDFLNNVKAVFKKLAFDISNFSNNPNEFLLTKNNNPSAIVYAVSLNSEIPRSEFAKLVEAVINFWNKNDVEPKGILVISAYNELSFAERKNPDYPANLEEFAIKKGICVVSSSQLLNISLNIDSKKMKAEDIGTAILNTSGKLPGLDLSHS